MTNTNLTLRPRFTALTPVLCAALLAGCPDDEEDGHSHDNHAGEGGHGHQHGGDGGCGLQANCMDTVEPAMGLAADGMDGVFTAEIVAHNELSVEDNMWTIAIMDADGAKVTDATVTVDIWSVDCMHGGPIDPYEVTANADGDYEVAFEAIHGGPWQPVFDVSAGGQSDEIRYNLCLPGDGHGGEMQDHSQHE